MSHRSSASDLLTAVLTGVVGFVAFNVIDGVFGANEAIVGLVTWIAATAVVVRRSPPGEEEPDA